MTITLIAALDRRQAIGYQGQLLFHIPADMRRFKALTMGHTLIMGRRTFESLPHGALPGRRNIVLSRQQGAAWPRTEVFGSFAEALQACTPDEQIFVIGGATVYAEAMPLAHRLCLTHIDAEAPRADVFFPQVNPVDWNVAHTETHESDTDGVPAYCFTDYVRKG